MTKAFGMAGRDRAVVRYGWDWIAESTVQAYQEVADG